MRVGTPPRPTSTLALFTAGAITTCHGVANFPVETTFMLMRCWSYGEKYNYSQPAPILVVTNNALFCQNFSELFSKIVLVYVFL